MNRCFKLGWCVLTLALATPLSAKTPWENIKTPSDDSPQVIGTYTNGCLQGGKALPQNGTGYQIVRGQRKRYFAHPDTVSFIESLGKYSDSKLDTLLLIADLSLPQGGRFSYGHRSHQTGLDADIWLRLPEGALSSSQLQNAKSSSVLTTNRKKINGSRWQQAHFDIIKYSALYPNVERIFVHPLIKQKLCNTEVESEKEWLRKVRPWWGHHAHMHVRLACPEGNSHCVPQAAPPEGDGCGDELMSWIFQPSTPSKGTKKKKAPPPAPEQCQEMLK